MNKEKITAYFQQKTSDTTQSKRIKMITETKKKLKDKWNRLMQDMIP